MTRGKSTMEYIVQGKYPGPHGWEDLTSHDTRKAAEAECAVYDANEPTPHRVIARRTKVIETK